MKAKARFLAGDHAEALASVDKATSAALVLETWPLSLIRLLLLRRIDGGGALEKSRQSSGARGRKLWSLRDQLREWADVIGELRRQARPVSAEIAAGRPVGTLGECRREWYPR